jgi:multiple sugar transport system substrate-binding protein
MTRRRIVLGTIAAVLLLCELCACSPPLARSPTPPPTVLPTAELTPTTPGIETLDPTGIEVHLWHSMTGDRESALWAIADQFEQGSAYGIRVRVEFHHDLHKEALAAIAAGTPPDLIVAPCEQIIEYASLDAVVVLEQYIESSTYGLTTLEQSDIWPYVLRGSCNPDPNGQPLGLLFDSQMVVMLYNAEWLEQLEAEAPPRTWDEFRVLCNAARDTNSRTWGYAAAVDGSIVVNWILGLGGTLGDPDTGGVALDSSEAMASLSVLQDLLRDECAYCASEPGSDLDDFSSQTVLFNFGTTARLRDYVAQTKTEDEYAFGWDIAAVPHLTEAPVVSVQGSTLSILRTKPQQQLAAWLFLKWLLRPRSDAQWVLASDALPMLRSTKYMSQVEAYIEEHPQYATACDLQAYAQSEPALPHWGSIRSLLGEAAAAVCQQETDTASALAAADVAADRLLAR